MENDVRWYQRLQNLEKSLKRLRVACDIAHPDETQRAGLIQFFEVSFELSWKAMKDYLETLGFGKINGPREVIKMAFQNGLIENGHVWLDALEDRNLTVHTYDDIKAEKIENAIRESYISEMLKFYINLSQKAF